MDVVGERPTSLFERVQAGRTAATTSAMRPASPDRIWSEKWTISEAPPILDSCCHLMSPELQPDGYGRRGA